MAQIMVSSIEDPVVLLERNLYGHPLAGLLWERQFVQILLKYGWEKVSNWECLFVHRENKDSVSHSLTESEIISLDAGLRMDGIPAPDLCDLIVIVLHANTKSV